MPASIFSSIIQNGAITVGSFLASTAVSFLAGVCIAVVYSRVQTCSRSFALTLALLPVIVELVIMLVNGNIGAGVAVAGAFSLVRFRSAQGTGQEILLVFFTMAVGLATGMGYLAIAVLFTVLVLLAFVLLSKTLFADKDGRELILKITIPETLDYEGAFDDILRTYTEKAVLEEVKTGKGSQYRLKYRIRPKAGISQKKMIDEIRAKNENLEVSCERKNPAEGDAL